VADGAGVLVVSPIQMDRGLITFIAGCAGTVGATRSGSALFSPSSIQCESDDADDEQKCDKLLNSDCHVDLISGDPSTADLVCDHRAEVSEGGHVTPGK
jgi:hypothetical protein